MTTLMRFNINFMGTWCADDEGDPNPTKPNATLFIRKTLPVHSDKFIDKTLY